MRTFTVFTENARLAAGSIDEVAKAAHALVSGDSREALLVFDDETGQVVDLDMRGTLDDVLARLATHPLVRSEPRQRGRPRLGVVSREVSLLPRHWAWLKVQDASASATVRRLVEEAMKKGSARKTSAAGPNAAYAAMTALAGDAPNYEEACRALFADDWATVAQLMREWPGDVSEYVLALGQRG